MKNIIAYVCTRGRYETTLLTSLMSIALQTLKPSKLILYDDNEEPRDLREMQMYQYLFQILDIKGIAWEVTFGQKKGQHFGHQLMNSKYPGSWLWRMDDDTVAEPDTLEKLMSYTCPTVGAVGGSILTPPFVRGIVATGKIEDIDNEQNLQWDYIDKVRSVDHLHCSFLYRAGIHDYELSLTRIAHREETLFTYGLKQKGYEILVVPAVTWHLKNKAGGIRDGVREMFEHDEQIFRQTLALPTDVTIVVLDCGMGDHIVFKHVLPDVKDAMVFSCYPEIVPGRSISEARQLLGEKIEQYNIYRMMDSWQWSGSLEDAFRKLYNAPRK
jgi:hypothetical protein